MLNTNPGRKLSPQCTAVLVSALLLQSVTQTCVISAMAEDKVPSLRANASNGQNSSLEAGSVQDFSRQYTDLTKRILLSAIDIERFALNYRLEGPKQPKLRRLRYFLGQEAGAAGGLAFEVTELDQFGKGRKNPLRIQPKSLQNALATTMTTSIIAGSGSALELSLNGLQAIKNKHNGYDTKSANLNVSAQLKKIDDMLAQRDALVSRNSDHPAYARAVAEGKILHDLRDAFVAEYCEFQTNTRSYLAAQNSFFLLNTIYNVLSVTAAGYAYKATSRPYLNGTANILFTITGATAMASPVLATVIGSMVRHQSQSLLVKQFGERHYDQATLTADCAVLRKVLDGTEGNLIPSLPSTERLAIYTESAGRFRKQLNNESRTARHFEKVALQTSEMGPIIGSTLMTQGILGTYGYYHFPIEIRKQIGMYYDGAVVGCVGTSMALAGNAAWLLTSWSYEQRAKKKGHLPAQLIKERLSHLDELQKTVSAL